MASPSSNRLCIRLFGAFEATRGGVPLPGLHIREGERLLAFLSLRANTPLTARELAERFWPAEARNNLSGQNDFPSLRQALFALRRALGPDTARLTRPSKTTIHFDLTDADVDILTFDRLARITGEPEAGHREGNEAQLPAYAAWEAAVALYRAPVLEAWNEAWAADARKHRQRALESVLQRLVQEAQQKGDGNKAEQWLRRLLAACPEEETAARDLMRLLAARGQYVEMKEVQETLEAALQTAGRSLEVETLALLAVLRAGREQRQAFIVSAQNRSDAVSESGTPILPHDAETAAPRVAEPEFWPEPAGGAVPVGSPFYVERSADAHFAQAVARRDSIILVKGARQVGKTSLLARGLQGARQADIRVAISDFQDFNADQFATPHTLLLALATTLAVQLDLETLPRDVWDINGGANMNLGLYLRRHALRAVSGHLIWALDEVDRLFDCPFGAEVFGLFRSWHNARALDPESPWTRLTLAIAYSTEASLFITDLNQSPFNVGTRLALQDFTLEQTEWLNRRYGSPLSPADVLRFYDLVGGQPYLTRRGLDELVTQRVSMAQLEAESVRDDGAFGEHLRRLLAVLSRSPEMLEVTRALLTDQACESPAAFFRLRTAGVVSGSSCQDARLRCRLYSDYLALRL